MPTKKPKPGRPEQEATNRSVRAGNKRDVKQDAKVKDLERRVKQIEGAWYGHLGVRLK